MMLALGLTDCVIGGSLLAGLVARRAGTPTAVLIGGGVCLFAAVWFATRLPALRRAARAREAEAAAVVAD